MTFLEILQILGIIALVLIGIAIKAVFLSRRF